MDSPVNQAAQLAKQRVDATAVSIYEHWRDEETFHLTGCVGGEPNVPGPASQLKRPERHGVGHWTGLTSFVAFNKEPLSIPLSSDGHNTYLDGQPIHVSMDTTSCEIADPGPFLAVPILDPHKDDKPPLGVIRAIRRRGLKPFTPDDQERLVWVARFLALSFIEERMRVELIDGLMSIVTCDTESDVLERIAAEATRLLSHPTAVFLQDPVRQDRYVFKAPIKIDKDISQKEYTKGSGGFTPMVLFGGQSHVVSPNLTVDTALEGPLHGVGHEPKAAELGTAQSQSFVAVPVPGTTKDGKPKGAIRASAPERYAISHRDAETLRALARQATVVLQKQEEKRDRDALFQTIVDTSARPIIAIDRRAQITFCNDAMATLLGIPKRDALNRRLLDVVYAGKKKLARANQAALDASGGKLRGHSTTMYRRCPSGAWLTVPVLVDASYLRSTTGEITGAVAYLEDLRGSGFENHIETVIGSPDQSGVTRELITVDRDTVKELRRFQQDVKRDTEGIILISGETGVGKETLAEAAAVALGRPTTVTVNCAGFEEGLLESELFGVEKGQATGVDQHEGLFKKHRNATFILDEIQELTPRVQAKLLRVLDTGRIRAIGKTEEALNIRVVALTNADIDKMEEQSLFRRDLKHRLEGMTFRLKPLRERRADVMQLADYFLERLRIAAPQDGPEGFSSHCINAFLNYEWPGNVRELQKAVALAFRRSADAEHPQLVVPFAALPERIQRASDPARFERGATAASGHERDEDLTSFREQMVDLQGRVRTLEARGAAVQFRRPVKPYDETLVEAIAADPDLPYRVLRCKPEDSEEALGGFFQTKGWLRPERSSYFELQKILYRNVLKQQVSADPQLRGQLLKGGSKAVTSFFEELRVRPPKNVAYYLSFLRSTEF